MACSSLEWRMIFFFYMLLKIYDKIFVYACSVRLNVVVVLKSALVLIVLLVRFLYVKSMQVNVNRLNLICLNLLQDEYAADDVSNGVQPVGQR